MLKGLTRLHTPELLHTLASMGHGDEIAVVDANFPADSMAQRIVRIDGADLPEALSAILQLMPLDTFVDDPAVRMEVVGAPREIPEVQRDCQKVINKWEAKRIRLTPCERFAFYERAKKAYAIVATGERRVYGCIIVKKGVVYSK
jgi:L-fucose mutarotase